LAQARAIVDCCRRKRLVAAVNHQLRFAPYMLALRDAFQRGWLGAMTDVENALNCSDPWHLFPISRANGASGNSGTFDPLPGFDPIAPG